MMKSLDAFMLICFVYINSDHRAYMLSSSAAIVLDARTQNGDEPVGEYSFLGQSCLSSADSC